MADRTNIKDMIPALPDENIGKPGLRKQSVPLPHYCYLPITLGIDFVGIGVVLGGWSTVPMICLFSCRYACCNEYLAAASCRYQEPTHQLAVVSSVSSLYCYFAIAIVDESFINEFILTMNLDLR